MLVRQESIINQVSQRGVPSNSLPMRKADGGGGGDDVRQVDVDIVDGDDDGYDVGQAGVGEGCPTTVWPYEVLILVVVMKLLQISNMMNVLTHPFLPVIFKKWIGIASTETKRSEIDKFNQS